MVAVIGRNGGRPQCPPALGQWLFSQEGPAGRGSRMAQQLWGGLRRTSASPSLGSDCLLSLPQTRHSLCRRSRCLCQQLLLHCRVCMQCQDRVRPKCAAERLRLAWVQCSPLHVWAAAPHGVGPSQILGLTSHCLGPVKALWVLVSGS